MYNRAVLFVRGVYRQHAGAVGVCDGGGGRRSHAVDLAFGADRALERRDTSLGKGGGDESVFPSFASRAFTSLSISSLISRS